MTIDQGYVIAFFMGAGSLLVLILSALAYYSWADDKKERDLLRKYRESKNDYNHAPRNPNPPNMPDIAKAKWFEGVCEDCISFIPGTGLNYSLCKNPLSGFKYTISCLTCDCFKPTVTDHE